MDECERCGSNTRKPRHLGGQIFCPKCAREAIKVMEEENRTPDDYDRSYGPQAENFRNLGRD